MEEFLKGAVLHWVQDWGYLAVFVGIMLENAGIPLPGETIIVIASVMAGQKLLNVWYVFGATVAGAVIGPNLGYYVGMRGGRPFLLKMAKLFRMSEEDLVKAEERFQKHSDWAIFLGRFVAFLRIFASPIAGVMRMPFHRFFIFNALGAVVWGGVVVGLAYVLGENVAVLLKNVGLTLLGACILGAAYLGFKLYKKRQAEDAAVASSQPE
ncbi:MAG: associated Golgi family protein [Cyanobacteria bacterium RYN_339]|nr:associated Golgi family protein [Cyanobacteria bacterium RYN_339]